MRKLDRASKDEQWYVDRFNEIKVDHKKLLTQHTAIDKPNNLKSVVEDLHKLSKREVENIAKEKLA